ncbi:Bacterial regulatory protein, luxR family [compost metagenome]
MAIFIGDPEQESRAPQEIVRALFDLTPSEAQLTLLLANGLTLDEASDELGISRNTARAHLRSTFSKTGVTRQTMLVRLILRSVATLG